MPSKEQMKLVGATCSEYDPVSAVTSSIAEIEVSCETCNHWLGEEEKCELDIFDSQLTSLDQT